MTTSATLPSTGSRSTLDEVTRQALELGERVAGPYSLAPPQRLESAPGGRLGRRPGSSLEFQEYRDYQPGDDLRHVDWAVYARSDHLVVRQFREEVQPHLDLLVDGSRSMAAVPSKQGATLALAAFFARVALAGGFSYGLWWGDGRPQVLARGPARPVDWPLPGFEHRQALDHGLERTLGRWRRKGLRVVLSDLLLASDPAPVLARLADGAASLVVVQVLAREEREPVARGLTRLEDAETGETLDLLLDARAVREYRGALSKHSEAWRLASQRLGATWLTVDAESLLESWGVDQDSPRESSSGRGDSFAKESTAGEQDPLGALLALGVLEARGGVTAG